MIDPSMGMRRIVTCFIILHEFFAGNIRGNVRRELDGKEMTLRCYWIVRSKRGGG